MSKSNAVRAVLARHETMAPVDIADEVGCTPPLVFQVIRFMERQEDELFEVRYHGRRVTYRLLPEDEARQRRAAKAKFDAEHRRRSELAQLREELQAARTMIDEALQRLDVLVA